MSEYIGITRDVCVKMADKAKKNYDGDGSGFSVWGGWSIEYS
jgi:hypothetical protein